MECDTGTERQRNHARLYNLGYRFELESDTEYDLAVRAFQQNYSIPDEEGLLDGTLPPNTNARLSYIYATGDASPDPEVESEAPPEEDPPIGFGPVTPEDTSDEPTSGKVVRIRLIGMHFDHAKCFMLSTALDGIRKINDIYKEHPGANLLLVGHTDTKHREDSADAGESFNKKLSLDRAKAIGAYLTDDVDAWYDWYNVEGERRWGTPEDIYMLSSVPQGGTPYYSGSGDANAAMKQYQVDQGLPTNIGVGERTRRALIRNYMNADDTTLPEGTKLTPHGCGPYFPDVSSGPNDDVPQNRRVEIFVFDGPIEPPPPGEYSEPGSSEYSAWLAQVGETIDFSVGGSSTVRFSIRLLDRDHNHDLYSGKPFEVVAEGQTSHGTSSDDGVVECWIPAEATSVVIRMPLGILDDGTEDVKEWTLSVVPSVPPVDTLRGILMRLHNLGYYEPMEGSTLDEDAQIAIRWFQSNHDLEENGDPDDIPTQQRLVAVHDA